MINKNITVADWMSERDITYVIDAEKYTLGQELSEDDAEEIKKFLWCSIAHDVGVGELGGLLQFMGENFVCDFHHLLMSLIWDPRVSDETNWSDALWDSMSPDERSICHKLMREMQQAECAEDDDKLPF